MNLNEFELNPNNPRVVSDSDIDRLVGKLKRVPQGLRAMRIAYVTDIIKDKKVVLSGNTRLQALRKLYPDGECPDEWFEDITSMSEAERHEFIVSANVNDGNWDIDKLLEQYDRGELEDYFKNDDLTKLIGDKEDWEQLDEIVDNLEPPDIAKPKKVIRIIIPEQLFESVDEIETAVRTNVISKFPECEVKVV